MRYAVVFIVSMMPLVASAQPLTLEPLPEHPISQTYHAAAGAFWADYDGDADLDLLVGNYNAPDELWVNTPAGFVLQLHNFSVHGSIVDAAWVDLDDDGDLDLPVASLGRNSLFINEGRGEMVYVENALIEAYTDSRALDVADVNGDGRLDLFYSRRYDHTNPLLLNLPTGFTLAGGDVSADAHNSSSSCWGDYDFDGDSDLYVGNAGEANDFYRNENGVLIRVTEGAPPAGAATTIACTWADVDNDGDLDLYLLNTGLTPNALYENQGGTFVTMQSPGLNEPGTDARNGQWADVDNDGDLDLLVVNRFEPAYLYENEGHLRFRSRPIDPEYTGRVWSENGALVDYDEDGDLDLLLVTGNSNVPAFNRLYRNPLDGAANWLAVLLDGPAPNRHGVGARIEAYAVVNGTPVRQLREMRVLPSRRTQTGYRVHFGLADAVALDSLVVTWPDGNQQVLYDIPINALYTVGHPQTSTGAEDQVPNGSFHIISLRPNPSNGIVIIDVATLQSGSVVLEVFDMLGRRLTHNRHSGDAGYVTLTWDTSGMPSGTYVVRVTQGMEQQTRTITVRR